MGKDKRIEDNCFYLLSEQLLKSIIKAEKTVKTLSHVSDDIKDFNATNSSINSSRIDKNTVNYIKYFINYVKKINFEYKNILFSINIYTNNYSNCDGIIFLIKIALICCLQDKTEGSDITHFELDLFLTDLKKKLPEIHANNIKNTHTKSGYSQYDKNIYVCIYRKEEWFKSFIHEIFYAFTLDFHDNGIRYKNILSQAFCLDNNFLLTDAIIEFFSRVFNASVFLYFEKKVNKYDIYAQEFEKMIHKEQIFALMQANKILNHFGVNYTMVIDEQNKSKLNKIYKEDTNAFCTYVITSIMFFHFQRMLQWIDIENNNFFGIIKNERELVILTHYIALGSLDEDLIQKFKKHSFVQHQSRELKYCYHRI